MGILDSESGTIDAGVVKGVPELGTGADVLGGG